MSELFRQEALDNRRERLWGEVVLVQPLSFWLLSGFVVLIVALVALLLLFGTYARRENVTGFLLPNQGLVKIYPAQLGLVSDVHVTEGQRVAAGELLFTISTGRGNEQASDVDAMIVEKLRGSRSALERRREERRELNALESARQTENLARFERDIAELESLVGIHEEKFRVSRAQLARLGELSAGQFVSETELIAARDAHVEVELGLAEARRRLAEKRDQRVDVEAQLKQLPLQASIELAEIDERLSVVDQRILEAGGRRTYSLRAPSAGKVTALQAAVGQRVREDLPLLAILPADARFRADLLVPTRAIGFVEPGQSVLLRYSAFPYERFGLYEGTVDRVTETVLLPNELDVPVRVEEPVYRVSVTPNKQKIEAYGREFDLQAGMQIEATIILEGRSLGEWLLAPLYSLRGTL